MRFSMRRGGPCGRRVEPEPLHRCAVLTRGAPVGAAVANRRRGASRHDRNTAARPSPTRERSSMANTGIARREQDDHPVGWRRYLYSTNHKDIGTMYLLFALAAGVIGGALFTRTPIEVAPPRAPSLPHLSALYL